MMKPRSHMNNVYFNADSYKLQAITETNLPKQYNLVKSLNAQLWI